MLNKNITPYELFGEIFPRSYFCAMKEGGGVYKESVPFLRSHSSDFHWRLKREIYEEDMRFLMEENKKNANIFFTPNSVERLEGRHRESNFNRFNSWYIDIDIDETKNLEGNLELREEKKAEIRGQIFNLPQEAWPSMTVETRNGFQLYWFCLNNPSKDLWMNVERGILEYFLPYGADRSSIKILQLLRVPSFRYWKKGETGTIKIFYPMSSGEKFTVDMMKQYFWQEPPVNIKPKNIKPSRGITLAAKGDNNCIFEKVHALPIRQVVMAISGHWLVNGEDITFFNQNSRKSNLLFNGKSSPVWIDELQNGIFSNSAEHKGPNITQFLLWYSWDKKAIAKGLKEIF